MNTSVANKQPTANQGLSPMILMTISMMVISIVTGLMVISNAELQHWFVIFPSLSGALLLTFLLVQLRKSDIFDPVIIIAVYLFYHVYVTPFLHVEWDFYWNYYDAPYDIVDWIGYLSILNFFGVLLFILATTVLVKNTPVSEVKRVWVFKESRFYVSSILAVGLGLSLFGIVLIKFGGLAGIVDAQESRIGEGASANPFGGMGVFTALSEFVPVLLPLIAVYWINAKIRRPSFFIVFFLLVAAFIGLVVFSGLRGSRAGVVWGLIWVAGVIHYKLYAFKVRHAVVGVLAIALFMNVFFFYKRGGMDALLNYGDANYQAEVTTKIGGYDDVSFMMLHDFGRTDIQTFALYRLVTAEFSLSWGRSYIASVVQTVPRAIWPSRPPGFLKERTDLLYGEGSYARDPDSFVPWIFGMPGELAVNFGWPMMPFAFLLTGLLAQKLRLHIRVWQTTKDSRLYMAPAFSIVILLLFMTDSHLYLYSLLKYLGVIFLVVYFSSRKFWLVPNR